MEPTPETTNFSWNSYRSFRLRFRWPVENIWILTHKETPCVVRLFSKTKNIFQRNKLSLMMKYFFPTLSNLKYWFNAILRNKLFIRADNDERLSKYDRTMAWQTMEIIRAKKNVLNFQQIHDSCSLFLPSVLTSFI